MLRRFSSWLPSAGKGGPTTSVDVEALFLDSRVQTLLRKLTGLSTSRIFRFRQYSDEVERPSYRLMTREEFDEIQRTVGDRAKDRLQIPPFKNARSEEPQLITHDAEIAGGDTTNMVFYDISPGLRPRDRLTLVREPDGRLRTGTGAERDRLHRTYYPSPNRPVEEPAVFQEPRLTEVLNEGKYEFVLDFACWYFEPDDPKYIKVSSVAYDHIDKASLHEKLWSTRHYGALVFYLVINKRIDDLLIVLLNKRKLAECADVVRLYRICNHDSKTRDAKTDMDLLKNFIQSDSKNRQMLENVLQAYKEAVKTDVQMPSKKSVEMKSS